MKKRMLSLLLALTLCLGMLSIPALAGGEIHVIVDDREARESNVPGVSYDASSNTLTLDNAKFSFLTVDGGVRIVLKGQNSIESDGSRDDFNTVTLHGGDVIIEGDGSLTVVANARSTDKHAPSAILVDDARLTVQGSAHVVARTTGDSPEARPVGSNLKAIQGHGDKPGTLTVGGNATLEAYSDHIGITSLAVTVKDNATLKAHQITVDRAPGLPTAALTVQDNATVILDSTLREGGGGRSYTPLNLWGGSGLNVSGGTLSVKLETSLQDPPDRAAGGPSVAMTALGIDSGNDESIPASNSTISGGTVKVDSNYLGMGVGRGTLTVTGGTLEVSAKYLGLTAENKSTIELKGGSVKVNVTKNGEGPGTALNGQDCKAVNISGGTHTFNDASALQRPETVGILCNGGTLNITGGDVTAYGAGGALRASTLTGGAVGSIQIGDGMAATSLSSSGTLGTVGAFSNDFGTRYMLTEDSSATLAEDNSNGAKAVKVAAKTASAPAAPAAPATPAAPAAPAGSLAYAATQSVNVDGKPVKFQMYALKDAKGNPTNYVKARDVAYVLNGTKGQFEVGYDAAAKAVNLIPGQAYTANGSEMNTPFSGDRAYTVPTGATNVAGQPSNLSAILLTSDSGGGFTYYKLRDLGQALGFNVSWSKEKGVFIESDKPYIG